jgi:hypothetical protein
MAGLGERRRSRSGHPLPYGRGVAVGSGVWRPDPWPDPAPHLLCCLFLTARGGSLSSQAREAELLTAGGGGPSSRVREAELLAAGGGGPSSPPELPVAGCEAPSRGRWRPELLVVGGGGLSSRPR